MVTRNAPVSRIGTRDFGGYPALDLAPPRLIGARMTAIRSVRAAEGKFVQISNAALQDDRLSWQARGILAFVLSLPPEQHFTAAWLETKASNGRESIRSALRELEAVGYLHRSKRQDARGHWSWEQILSDATESSGDDCPSDGIPSSGSAPSGSPSDKRSNTEEPKDVGRNDLASRHARAKSSASKQRDIPTVIREVRAAAAQEYGENEAAWLSDEALLGLYCSKVGTVPPVNLVAYMAKIMGDAPNIDSLLSNSEAVCVTCLKWDSECRCRAA
jgi:hypothetical protein